MSRKAFFFMTDVLIGFSLIVMGITLLLSFYYKIPLATQPSHYSNDLVRVLTSTPVGSLDLQIIRDWYEVDYVSETTVLGELYSKLCSANDNASFANITSIVAFTTLKDFLSYSVKIKHLNETTCLEYGEGELASYSSAPFTSVTRSLILNIDSNFSVDGPYIMEVAVW